MVYLCQGAEFVGKSGTTWVASSPLDQENVWIAYAKHDRDQLAVLKAPNADDSADEGWPRFRHEVIMHELFKRCAFIRRQIDRIPPDLDNDDPSILVLEYFETTLWKARVERPMSKAEIKAIARSVLQSLQEIHDADLVHCDLKMPNILINGFDKDYAGDGSSLYVSIGDLGIVMPPMKGKAQPITYRAPEVYFRHDIASAADIWAFGLIYCHLLEAQHQFLKLGLYDGLDAREGTQAERETAIMAAMVGDYDDQHIPYYYGCSLPPRREGYSYGSQWTRLRDRGLEEDDISFLKWVLQLDPTKRPSAKDILQSRWMTETDHNGWQSARGTSHVDEYKANQGVHYSLLSSSTSPHRDDHQQSTFGSNDLQSNSLRTPQHVDSPQDRPANGYFSTFGLKYSGDAAGETNSDNHINHNGHQMSGLDPINRSATPSSAAMESIVHSLPRLSVHSISDDCLPLEARTTNTAAPFGSQTYRPSRVPQQPTGSFSPWLSSVTQSNDQTPSSGEGRFVAAFGTQPHNPIKSTMPESWGTWSPRGWPT